MIQIVLLLAFVIPGVLFVLSQRNLLRVIDPENREMDPGSVWLQLIPVFGLIWQFIVVVKIAHSVSKEIATKIGQSILDDSNDQITEPAEYPTYSIGLAYCILTTLGIVINYAKSGSSIYLRQISSLCLLAGMICWIIYWIRVVKTKNKLTRLSTELAKG